MEPTSAFGTSETAASEVLTCPLCGSEEVRTTEYRETFPHGTGASMVEIVVDVPIRYCKACDFYFQDLAAERLKQEALCRHLGVLTPDEVRSIRTGYRMSRSEFAKVTGIGEASLNRWENGANVQTVANDKYLRLIADPGTMRMLRATESPARLGGRPIDSVNQRFPSLADADRALAGQGVFELRLGAMA